MARWHRAVVVGASSGIGEAIARLLGQDGSEVALVARRGPLLEQIAQSIDEGPGHAVTFVADVRKTGEAQAVFQRIADALGGLDLVVYASGVMPGGTARDYPTDEDIAAIETNFAGAVAWLNAAARYFQDQRSGTIVGIGSIAGDRGRRSNPVYNATKSALATYLESLRYRLARRGVTVVTVKPGWVRTAMIGWARTFPPAESPDRAAAYILEAASLGKRVVYVPPWWRWIAILLKITPAPLMERLPV